MTKSGCTVVYSDNHLLIVDKPSGMLTQPNESDDASAEAWAKAWIKDTCGKPGKVFLHAVHRLDRPVSGLVVFARTSKALSRLNEAMRSKECRKIYHAHIEGVLPHPEGRMEDFLVHDAHKARIVKAGTQDAVKAVLSYRVLETKDGGSLVEIELETGRYHQIRAQMAAAGCPIRGDVKYGATSGDGSSIGLRHVSIAFPHPIGGERREFRV